MGSYLLTRAVQPMATCRQSP